MKKVLFVALALLSLQAHSAVWTADFTISHVYVAGLNNYQYRVYGMSAMPECPTSQSWAYINKADGGSEGYVAAIFLAFATGRPVRAFVEPQNGFCHILELILTA